MIFLLVGKGRRRLLRYLFSPFFLVFGIFWIWSIAAAYQINYESTDCTIVRIVKPRKEGSRPTISCGDGITYMFKPTQPGNNISDLEGLKGAVIYEQDVINSNVRTIRKFHATTGQIFLGKTTFEPIDSSTYVLLGIVGALTLLGFLNAGYLWYQTNDEERYRRLVARVLKVVKYDGPI